MELVWLLERLKTSDPTLAKRALTMCRLIDKNIEDIRGMAIRLRPGVLDDLGLVDALEWYASDFEKRTKITCFFAHDPIPEIGDTIATAAYRITQEALTNVARHSGANRVDVKLFYQNNFLRLSVKDNGSGFDAAIITELEGLGLAGMQERASLVGGTFKIRTRPQKGTHIFFKVPV
jgi:signal transduction histidine kinase